MAKVTFPFSLLPAELRNKIYRYCIISCGTAVLHPLLWQQGLRDFHRDFVISEALVFWTRIPAITKTCRQFWNEFFTELYNEGEPEHVVRLHQPQNCGTLINWGISTTRDTVSNLTIRFEDIQVDSDVEYWGTPYVAIFRKELNMNALLHQLLGIAWAFPYVKKLKMVFTGGFMTRGEGIWLREKLRPDAVQFPNLVEFLLLLESEWKEAVESGEAGEWVVLKVV
jgi:hypothetical protein